MARTVGPDLACATHNPVPLSPGQPNVLARRYPRCHSIRPALASGPASHRASLNSLPRPTIPSGSAPGNPPARERGSNASSPSAP